MVRKLILHTLRCDGTEDYIGGDETFLEIFTDGQQRTTLRQDMKKGDTWSLNKSYDFNNDASIKLWDEDNPRWGDPNDFLGEFKVSNTDVNFGIARFTKGADYSLTYTVTTDRPPAPVTPTLSHITIELIDVYCDNTEDVTGADEFYILGGVTVFDTNTSTTDPSLARPILTKKVDINDRQTKPLNYKAFDSEVKSSYVIYMEMAAYDEDVAKDWSQHETWVGLVGTAVGTVVGFVATPVTGLIVKAGLTALTKAPGFDIDDRLGIYSQTLTVKDLKPGESIYQWNIVEKGIGYSTWNYTVKYKVTVK
ncbi:hypothetical protein H6G64_14190 [Calothrix sp. FACHB-156]|nr:hypothetical protein [Calothrix sp. FACHB-156]